MAVTAREPAQKVLSAMGRAVARWRRRGAGSAAPHGAEPGPDPAVSDDPLADWFARVRRAAPQLLEPGSPNRVPRTASERPQGTPASAPSPPRVRRSSGAVPDEWRATSHHSDHNAPLDVSGVGAPGAVESRAVESRAVESRAVESRAVEPRAVEPRALPAQHRGRRLPDLWRSVLHRAAGAPLRISTVARRGEQPHSSRPTDVAAHDVPSAPVTRATQQAVYREPSKSGPAWPVLSTTPERSQPPTRREGPAAEQRSVPVLASAPPPPTPEPNRPITPAVTAGPRGTRRFPTFDGTASALESTGRAEPVWPDWTAPAPPTAEPDASTDDPWPQLPAFSDLDTTVAVGPDVDHLRALRHEHEVWH